ncbi:MAG: HRDC domain-containing protein [Pirellulales bacterium]|nr:HRDC domain-containing protein [Pirellulales bacterium]
MNHHSISSPAHLADLCQRLARADRIGIDTEFVSEDTYRPELCLVQVATADDLAVIDPYRAGDLTAFWNLLAEGNHSTIIHAAREEVNFALTACGKPPANLFDTQVAAGFCGPEFPSSYASVVTRFLNAHPSKGEQRTDWRRRPLSNDQLNYALEDVRYLLPLYESLGRKLGKLNRLEWLGDETERWLADVIDSRESPRWRRVSGLGNLSTRSLAIVRELWLWRRHEAERRNLPPRRILRDDLLVEIAKRKSTEVHRLREIRGIHGGMKREVLEALAACVERGLVAPLDDIEREPAEAMPPQLNLLGQFLAPALSSICRNANVATSLVGTATDVRDLIAYRLGFGNTENREPPSLATGWRADVVGHLIEELLAGKKSIRIENPLSEHPLAFDDLRTG